MKRITITTDDETAMQLVSLFADKHITSLLMENILDKDPRRAPNTKHVVPGTTAARCMAEHFPLGQSFRLADAEKLLTRQGYSINTAMSSLSTMVKEGFAEKVGRGQYKILRAIPVGYVMGRHP